MQTRQLVPMVFVKDVERSIGFYRRLRFEVGNTFAAEASQTTETSQTTGASQTEGAIGAAKPTWAWLYSGEAQVMLALANEPIVAEQQRVLFYLYTDDVAMARAELAEAGLNPGEITTPFYAPRGEFQLIDPDGYVLMITHTGA